MSAHQRQQLLSCGAECKGLLVSLVFKLVLLAAGTWGVFLRKPRSTMPRIFLFRASVLLLVLVCTFSYWLFYVVQITEGRIYMFLFNTIRLVEHFVLSFIHSFKIVTNKLLNNFYLPFIKTLLPQKNYWSTEHFIVIKTCSKIKTRIIFLSKIRMTVPSNQSYTKAGFEQPIFCF